MSKSDDLENKVLDHVLGGGDYTRLATVYIALFTTAPNDAGAGGVEVSGTGYARVAVTNNATNFPAAAAGAKSNGTIINFGTAGSDWAAGATQVVAFAIMSLATGGVFLYIGNVTPARNIVTGNAVSFPVGDLDITED